MTHRAIHRLPIFEICVILYSVWRRNILRCNEFTTDFFNPVFTGSNIVLVKFHFCMFFGHSSFRENVLSVRCLSAICPFGHFSFGHMSFRPFVFRPSVLPPWVNGLEYLRLYRTIYNSRLKSKCAISWIKGIRLIVWIFLSQYLTLQALLPYYNDINHIICSTISTVFSAGHR